MLEQTKLFYNKTKIKKVLEVPDEEPPLTYVKVFYKEYPRLPSIELPSTTDPDSVLETLLEMRQSMRLFSDKPLELKDVAKIFKSCRIVDINRNPERRTYPSGGARFPIETYLVSFNIKKLEQGAYHYNIKRETLEQLLKKDLRNRRRELISPYLDNPAATLIFTSVISRSEVKYGYNAYNYSLLEAGHMGQNIHLACTEIGVGSCSVSGFVADSVKEILDLTDEEIPLYTISIGKRKLI